MILSIGVRTQYVNHVWVSSRAKDALIIPALPGAEVEGGITNIRYVAAGLLHEGRTARLHRLGDPEAAVWRAAVAFTLIHARVSIRRGCNGEFASIGREVARDLARVDIGPVGAVVSRTPDAHVVGGRVDHARVRRVDSEGSGAAGRPEARLECLPGLPA